MADKPVIAVAGRPNTGKSTFVNRILGSRRSIVDDEAGVTRDRIYFDAEWRKKEFTIIDTGGIIPDDGGEIMRNIFTQAEIACREADKIIFIVDGKEGINPVDYDIANILRRSGKEVFLAVNKIDTPDKILEINDFYALSIGEPYAISALHGSGGIGDLLDAVTKDFEVLPEEEKSENIRIAIAGKPNAGKSSIVNALLNKERVIVSDISGTTRDAIDSKVKFEGEEFILVDTAGIRKKSKVDWGIEKFAVERSIRAIRNSDVTILVIDALEGVTEQDKKIAGIILDAGKAVVLAVNKWDLIENKTSSDINKFKEEIDRAMPFLSWAPKVFISAKTKQRLVNLYKLSKEVYSEASKRVSTSLLNKVIMDAVSMNQPPSIRGKRLKLYYASQVKTNPPMFVLFINKKEFLKDNYIKYLENKLREAFGFKGAPVKIAAREKEDKK